MKNVKKSILNLLAKAGLESALKAAGAASFFGYHQPKEPIILKSIKKWLYAKLYNILLCMLEQNIILLYRN